MHILFVCVHNAGRSQMAEAFVNRLAEGMTPPIRGVSAGTVGGSTINPMAQLAMEEIGIPLTGHQPKLLDAQTVEEADRIISMGCGVDATQCPTRFMVTEDWGLDDPAGQPIEMVREIRDQIRARVEQLLRELTVPA